MKKKIFGVALAAVSACSVFALSSCGKKQVENAGEEFEVLSLNDIKGTSEPIVVEFWHSFGDAISPALETLCENFETEMKDQGYNIDVNLVNKGGGYDGLRSAVNLGTSSNAIPTMILGYPDHFADYIKNDILLPLDEFVYAKDSAIALEGVTKDSNDFIPSYWAENQMLINGKTQVAGIPFNKSTEIMVYNSNIVDPILEEKGYLDSEGKWSKPTWEQVFDVSQYILDHKNSLGYSYKNADYKVHKDMEYPVFIDSEANFFITVSRQWGGEGAYTRINENGEGVVTAKNEKNREAQNYFLDKAKAKLFQFPAKVNQNYGSKLLVNLQSFISIGSTAGIKNNTAKGYYLKATGIPQKSYTDGTQAVIQQGTNLAILTANSNNRTRLAAWMLIKYLCNTKNTEYFSKETGYLPVRQSARNSDTFKAMLADENNVFTGDVAKAINAAFAQADYFYTDPAFSGSSIVRDNASTIIQDMYIYNKTYDQAMTNFYAELDKLRIKNE